METGTNQKYSFGRSMSEFLAMRTERSEWEQEWKEISNYLVPGRGIYQMYSKPRKRKLTSSKVVNPIAKQALRVLTAGLQGNLTSPTRPWLELSWQDKNLAEIGPLKDWLFDCQERLTYALQQSNFYPTLHSFYIEYAAFGTGSIYVGADNDLAPFRFEVLTAGEYVFSSNFLGRVDKYYRMIFMTPRQLYDRFGKTKVSESVRDIVEKKSPSQESKYIPVMECIYADDFRGKPFTQVFWEVAGAASPYSTEYKMPHNATELKPLSVAGFYEIPYSVARWDTIGQDEYGLGPGSEVLEDIKRLQQMEKAFLMATHKDINPPLNAPSYMRGKLKTLPGGHNYYRNPQEKIESIYNVRFNYEGVGLAMGRVEERIQRMFFNDAFLTAVRDPNASPMKAAEVNVKEGEKVLRLGPIVERLQNEFIEPTIERCFNIMDRKGEFPPFPQEYVELVGESGYNIDLVSPLAQAQKLAASQSIQTVLAFAANAAPIAPEVLDKFDIDAAVDEMVDIHGAPRTILRTDDEVKDIRAKRQQQATQEKAKEDAIVQQQMAAQGGAVDATTRKTHAETGQIMSESLVDAQALGRA